MQTDKQNIVQMLSCQGEEMTRLLERAGEIRTRHVGQGVYLRGLIEYSNVCRKNCLYCGIRRDADCSRYTLDEAQVLECARFADENNYGSVVLQGGENQSPSHIETIERLIYKIKELSAGRLGITLSLGEQSARTYRRWMRAGAHRYLLRIETSNPRLYGSIHPGDSLHLHADRLRAIRDLRETGYQVGTGVMIGLPGQRVADLADDLLFMKSLDIDMCGMGPYVPSRGTPLATHEGIPEPGWRFSMALKMVATLRILMPDINIAATTALHTFDPDGRLKAIAAGANVIMPNLTPGELRKNYMLYDDKPMALDSRLLEQDIRYGEWGDSLHFSARNAKRNKSC